MGTYVSLAYHRSLPLLFLSRSSAVLHVFSSSLANPSFFLFGAGWTIRSSLASASPRPLSSFPSLTSFARSSSSSSLVAFGYHLGHPGHPSRYTRYVVCPIFTHGKSTLKKRWAPARSSFLSSPTMFASLFFYPVSRLLLNKHQSRKDHLTTMTAFRGNN